MATTDKLSSRNQAPGSDAQDRLQTIIDWADLAHAHPEEFASHGLGLLRGPIFDDARDFLADQATCDASIPPARATVALSPDYIIKSMMAGSPPASVGLVEAVRAYLAAVDDYTALRRRGECGQAAYLASYRKNAARDALDAILLGGQAMEAQP